MKKSRKHNNKYRKWTFYTRKRVVGEGVRRGGGEKAFAKDQTSTENKAIDKIKQEVANENGANKNSQILAKTKEIAQGATINALNTLGEMAGLDLTDPNLVQNNRKKIQQMTKNAAEIGSIALEAAKPFTKPLIDQTVEAGSEALSKMGETGVKVVLNTAEEIPGVGVLIGSVRSLSNIGEAIVSSVNAGSEVISSASDSLNASLKNFNRLMEEKQQILNRTQSSVNEFKGGSSSNPFHKKKQFYVRKHNKSRK